MKSQVNLITFCDDDDEINYLPKINVLLRLMAHNLFSKGFYSFIMCQACSKY